MANGAVRAGKQAGRSETARKVVLFGWAAKGVVYLTLAYLVLQMAFGSAPEDASTTGALQFLASKTPGKIALVVLGLGLLAYAVGRILEVTTLAGPGIETKDKVEAGVLAFLYTALAITAFGSLLGIVGAIMAIPLAVVLQVLFERVLQTAQQGPTTDVTGRDQIAVLRYEAQGLATNLRNRVRDLPDRADQTNFEEELEALVGEIDHILQVSATPGNGDAKPVSGSLN